jgi:gliding motility associated protien GldN
MNKFSLFSGLLLTVGSVLGQDISSTSTGSVVTDSDTSKTTASVGSSENETSSLFKVPEGYNKYSTKQIHESDIMWKKGVWRQVDLRERQNKPLMSRNREIIKVLVESVQGGIITPYTSDSLAEGGVLNANDFNMKIVDAEMSKAYAGVNYDDTIGYEDWEKEEWVEQLPPTPEATEFKNIYLMNLREDMLFDKQRSVMYYDIIAVGLSMPAEFDVQGAGAEREIAWFSYKELEEKVFHTNPDAIWYNPANDAEHRNLSDSFELRLFSSYITKVSNPDDLIIVDIYGGGQTGIMASEWKAFELLEFEHNLWEF